MRLLTTAAAALLATAAWAQSSAPVIPSPYDPDLIVADDRPVVLTPRVKRGESALTWSARYRRTGRLVHDTTFSTLGFGKRTLAAGTALYFRHFSDSPLLGIEFSVWCAPELRNRKGRALASCILYRDGGIAMKKVELIEAPDANPWLVGALKLGSGGTAPRPEIREEEVGFPTIITQSIVILHRKGDRQYIELVDEATCDGCPATKITEVRAARVEADGTAAFVFGDTRLVVRPADEGLHDVTLEGPLTKRLAAS